jgi:hypothetical protein
MPVGMLVLPVIMPIRSNLVRLPTNLAGVGRIRLTRSAAYMSWLSLLHLVCRVDLLLAVLSVLGDGPDRLDRICRSGCHLSHSHRQLLQLKFHRSSTQTI